MAMINCSECGKDVSDKAATCPNCGVAIKQGKLQDLLDVGKKHLPTAQETGKKYFNALKKAGEKHLNSLQEYLDDEPAKEQKDDKKKGKKKKIASEENKLSEKIVENVPDLTPEPIPEELGVEKIPELLPIPKESVVESKSEPMQEPTLHEDKSKIEQMPPRKSEKPKPKSKTNEQNTPYKPNQGNQDKTQVADTVVKKEPFFSNKRNIIVTIAAAAFVFLIIIVAATSGGNNIAPTPTPAPVLAEIPAPTPTPTPEPTQELPPDIEDNDSQYILEQQEGVDEAEPTPEPTPIPDATPTPEPYPMPTTVIREPIVAEVGDIIQFGNYNWRVLDVQENYALIITENILERRYFRRPLATGAATWAESSLRIYLNTSILGRGFLGDFSEEEIDRIRETTVTTNNNPWYGTSGGAERTDKVFILSIEEVLMYFGDSGTLGTSDDDRTSFSDQYDSARTAYREDGTDRWDDGRVMTWWLRSPGFSESMVTIVRHNGAIDLFGSHAWDPTEMGWNGVRPALWLHIG